MWATDLFVLIDRGGFIMVPLLALSVISIMLIVERIFFWTTVHRPGRARGGARRLRELNTALRLGDRSRARELLASDRTPYGEVARSLLEHGAGDAVAMEAVEVQRPRLDRFMVSLSTIVTAAPLLGILGTVIGIIRSFNLIGAPADQPLTDPSAVSAGIAEALLTTALGLMIALFTLFPYMFFRAQVERAMGRMESVIAAAQQGEAAGSGSGGAPDGRSGVWARAAGR